MVRKNRVIYEGAIYHINTRGNNREYIFENPKHKAFLLKQIKEYNKVFDFDLLAYVIMDNHYHLLIRTNKIPIDEIMFNLNNLLGKYLNRELKRTGHVFERRYSSKLVDSDAYLLWVLRYIHRNPIRAHMCSTLDEYRWSSHFFYRRGIDCFVNTNFILNILSRNRLTARKQYLELMFSPGDENNLVSDLADINQRFDIHNKLTDSNKNTENIPLKKTIAKIRSLEAIFNSLELDIENKNLLRNGSRRRTLTPYKVDFIKQAIEDKYTLKEISKFLCISQPAISLLLSSNNISLY